ncbi:hypothetical protein SGUI_1356 [Serinicoccus hydrothermalis]|uniref:Uncharacterized protein n=1 Tax=Serinicoccus hydrothermalis TaxID=1758689 RepID=A0A1B1NBF6_9MICO|nr:hypothetical protein [Serinicoccus hydrothermalis]ANS78752.1 hypothetical protein SGUI_1356 [Serinicoccus hydrothermalis]
MSEQLTQELRRAVGQAPPTHLSTGALLAEGRRRVRRRRAVGLGSGVGALALVGSVWLGLGDPFGPPEVSPASVVWEVEEPTTLTLVDRDTQDGVSSVVVSRTATSSEAVVVVDGEEETITGARTDFGAELYAGGRASVLVWQQPGAAEGAQVLPASLDPGEIGPVQGPDDLWYAVLEAPARLPEDLLFHGDGSVWTAGGEVADTAVVGDGRVERRVFSLPDRQLSGVVDGAELVPPGDAVVGVDQLPWWRGGDDVDWVLARLPQEADRARLVTTAPGRHVGGGPVVDTVQLGDSAFALASRPAQPGSGQVFGPDLQWSADGQEWNDRDGDLVGADGLAGVDVTGTDSQLRATRAGVPLVPVPGLGADVWAWEDGDEVVLVADVEEKAPMSRLVPVVRWPDAAEDGGPASALAPQLVQERSVVEVDGRELMAAHLQLAQDTLADHEDATVIGAMVVDSSASRIEAVQVVGAEPGTLETGADDDLFVAFDGATGLWVVHRGDVGRALVADGPRLVGVELGSEEWDLVARLPGDGGDPALVPVDDSMTVQQPIGTVSEVGGIRWWSLTVQAPGMDDLRDGFEGLDTDGDGETDLPLDLFIPQS